MANLKQKRFRRNIIDFLSKDFEYVIVPSFYRRLFRMPLEPEEPGIPEDSWLKAGRNPVVLKKRWDSALGFIVPLSVIFSSLIIGGSVSLGLLVPKALLLIGGPLVMGTVAATPVGWAILGLVALILTALVVREVFRRVMAYANKNDWGGALKEENGRSTDSRTGKKEISLRESFEVLLAAKPGAAKAVASTSIELMELKRGPSDSLSARALRSSSSSPVAEVKAPTLLQELYQELEKMSSESSINMHAGDLIKLKGLLAGVKFGLKGGSNSSLRENIDRLVGFKQTLPYHSDSLDKAYEAVVLDLIKNANPQDLVSRRNIKAFAKLLEANPGILMKLAEKSPEIVRELRKVFNDGKSFKPKDPSKDNVSEGSYKASKIVLRALKEVTSAMLEENLTRLSLK